MERKFSKGRLLLSYTRGRLSVQSTRAALCLGDWSQLGYVEDSDIMAAARQPDSSQDGKHLGKHWDKIYV